MTILIAPGDLPASENRTNFYISTGRKSAMFTMRICRVGKGFVSDSYICNLATDPARAEEKARDYFDRVSPNFPGAVFDIYADEDMLNQRRGRLSVEDTKRLEDVESGFFPFGKHKGERIAAAPDKYILWCADQRDEVGHVMAALSAACMGVALERGLIAKRDAQRAAQAEQDAKSNFVGAIGERLTIEGEVVSSFYKEPTDYQDGYTITKIRQGDDLFVYWGNEIGKRGDQIKVKATVKRHAEYKGVKSTTVNRPKLISLTPTGEAS